MKGLAISTIIGLTILGLGSSQISYGHFEGSPLDQWDDGVLIPDITCRDGRELMIDLRGKPGCAFDDKVDRLKDFGWTLVEQSPAAQEKEAMMEQQP